MYVSHNIKTNIAEHENTMTINQLLFLVRNIIMKKYKSYNDYFSLKHLKIIQ